MDSSHAPTAGDTAAAAGRRMLRRIPLPPVLHVPLARHEATPVIEALPQGTRVRRGQPLAEVYPGAPVPLAPVAGRVAGRRTVQLFNGRDAAAVSIEPDPLAAAGEGPEAHHEAAAGAAAEASREELERWLQRLAAGGVWADRHGSPDLAAQLQAARDRPPEMVVCSLLEADPALPLNSVLASRMPTELLAGLEAVAQYSGAGRRLLVAEAGQPLRWWRPVRRHARRAKIDLAVMRNDYPQADPTLLLHVLLDRRLRPGQNPVECGVILLDGAAAIDAGRLVMLNQPMLLVPVGIFDHTRGEAHFVMALTGTPLRFILSALHLPLEQVELRGGEMLRNRRLTADAVVAGAELTVHLTAPYFVPASPCIRCAWCIDACPTRIYPAGLLEAAQRRDRRLGLHFGIEACIECGICSYVCPSHLPLLEAIRSLKSEI